MQAIYNRENAGEAALEFCRRLTGKPYVWGGIWPESGGTDCDGLVTWGWGQAGVKLARPTTTTYKEYPMPHSAPNEVGCLLFIEPSPTEANPGHVMMFVAPGRVFQAEETGVPIGEFAYDTDRWEFRTNPALALPKPAKPKTPAPSAAELSASLLILLPNGAAAHEAVRNGWPLYKWDGWKFIPAAMPCGIGGAEYAYFDYTQRHA